MYVYVCMYHISHSMMNNIIIIIILLIVAYKTCIILVLQTYSWKPFIPTESHCFIRTFSWVDYCMYVVDGSISVDVSVGGVVRRETKAAQGTTLVQVQHINTLIEIHIITHYLQVHEN